MSREDAVRTFFDTIDHELGAPDVLVNNAAITGPVSRLIDVDIDDVRKVMALNITGLIVCCQEAVRRMARSRGGRGGRIINVSSRASTLGGANEWLHYAASKGAVDTFTKGLAEEVASEGIRVNGVSPGVIDTDMQAPGRVDRLAGKIPLGRAGTAEEVAQAIIWLASDAASYVAGCTLPVTGGR